MNVRRVTISLPVELLDAIDKAREDLPRSRYLARSVRAYMRQQAIEDEMIAKASRRSHNGSGKVAS